MEQSSKNHRKSVQKKALQEEEEDEAPAQLPAAKPPPRVRTTSESPHKFIVKPVINAAAKRGSCGPTDAMTRQVLVAAQQVDQHHAIFHFVRKQICYDRR